MKKKIKIFSITLIVFVLSVSFSLFIVKQKTKKTKEVSKISLISFDRGDWQKAAYQFEKELVLDSSSKQTILQLAIIYDDYLNNKSEAIKYYERYLQVAPNDEKVSLVKQWLEIAKNGKTINLDQKKEISPAIENKNLELSAVITNKNQTEENVEQIKDLKTELKIKVSALEKAHVIINENQLKLKEYQKQIDQLKISETNREKLNESLVLSQKELRESLKLSKEYEYQIKNKEEELSKLNEQLKALDQINLKLKDELEKQKQIYQEKQSRNYKYQEFIKLETDNSNMKKKIKIMEAKIIRLYGIIGSLQASNKNLKSSSVNVKNKNTKHRVKKGESLRTIATDYYGDKDKWRLIYNVNKNRIDNPNVLTTGQILEIPEDAGSKNKT